MTDSEASLLPYREALLAGRGRVGVWGIGHIGYSTMCHFAEQGVAVVGVDVDPARVETVNRGENPIFAMDYWLGFTPAYLFQQGTARATTDWQELLAEDVLVHFVCVPTERNGLPYLDVLGDVFRKIATLERGRARPPLVVIESTLTPNTTDRFVIPLLEEAGVVVGRDVLLGTAPRRDWFATPDASLRTLARVMGGTDERTTAVMKDVLGIVCENLVPATDHLHAEVVKSIENAYRHMEISLANQLTLAYPHLDMRTVLELVGTKWNIGTYFPSMGIGGYCIPLASHYVLEGAQRPEFLTLLQDTIVSSEAQPRHVVEHLVQRGDIRRVGIIGLSYTHNMKVWAQSPTLKIAPLLRERGIEVAVADLHYSDEEIRRITGSPSFTFPEGLGRFDAILFVSGHREYAAYPHPTILGHLAGCRLVLDNTGMWKGLDFASRGIEYHVVGDRHWLGTGDATNDRFESAERSTDSVPMPGTSEGFGRPAGPTVEVSEPVAPESGTAR